MKNNNENSFNNKIREIEINGNDNNTNINATNKQNKENQIDKSNKNCNNSYKIEINKTINDYEYTELTKEELKKLKKEEKSKRYGLAKFCGESIRCIGLLKDSVICDKTEIERAPVINLVDINGNYLSDHINIERDLVEHLFDDDGYDVVIPIEIYGRVYKYGNGIDRYAVDPNKLKNGYVRKIQNTIINTLAPINYINSCKLDYNDLVDNEFWLQNTLNTNELKCIIDYLRRYINMITKNDLTEDFVYNYIINNYLLNSSQFNLFYKELPVNKLNKNHYIELIYLLINVLMEIVKCEQINISTLFQEIGKMLLPFMGVKPNLNYKNTIEYERFVKSLNTTINELDFVVDRVFNNFKVHPFDVYTKNVLVTNANYFIKTQKQNLEDKIIKTLYNNL